ncbi:MAG TPA: hypothetical protein VK858_22070 [Longimicrobiales bacterium]|nr:hypothetical protein [Longimicrobiales bacterium]
METLIDGNAWDRFQNNAPIPCQGTGKLEAELAGVVRARLAESSG